MENQILELVRNETGRRCDFVPYLEVRVSGRQIYRPAGSDSGFADGAGQTQGQGLVQFNESIRGRENQSGLSAYTNVVKAAA